MSAEDGAILRSYDASFKNPGMWQARRLVRKYGNKEFVKAFEEKIPKCILADYNLTLAGSSVETRGERINPDTAILLKNYISTAKKYWAGKRGGEDEPYFGIISGNYSPYLVDNVSERGFNLTNEKLWYKVDTSKLETRWKKNADSKQETPGPVRELYSVWGSEMAQVVREEFPRIAGTFQLVEREIQPTFATSEPKDPECSKALKRLREYSIERFGLKMSDEGGLVAMHPDSIELLVPEHTKENSLDQIQDLFGKRLSDAAYCGDSITNDYEALARTSSEGGYVFVMSNERYKPSKRVDPWVAEYFRQRARKLKEKLVKNNVPFFSTRRESVTAGAGMNEVLASATVAMDQEMREGKTF